MSVPFWVAPQSVLIVLLHAYLWWRLVSDTTRPGSRARRVATGCLIVLGGLIPAALVGTHTLPPSVSRWFAWPGYVWYGLLVYLLVILVLAEPVRITIRLLRRAAATTEVASATASTAQPALVGAPTMPQASVPGTTTPVAQDSPPQRPEPTTDRRRFLARSVALVAGVGAAAVAGPGMVTALSPPRLEHARVRLRRLATPASGFRIALVSDIHLGALLGRGHTERIVELINHSDPDLVAIVGDLVDGTVPHLGPAAAPLRHLRSRHGTYFVTGNHEYISGAGPWLDELRNLGVRPLENERTELPYLDLAGVNDVSGAELGKGPDYDAALGGRDPHRPVVLLAHQPVQVHEAAKRGVDLQLSGHTHGGQLWPLSLLTAAVQPTLAGWAKYGETQLYVTKGAGFWGPAVRVGAPPDITVIELTS